MNKEILIRRAKAGGKSRGWQERKEALLRYHSTPHFCLNCKSMIHVGDKRVADVMKKKFCDSSCAATYNNLNHPERYGRHRLDSAHTIT